MPENPADLRSALRADLVAAMKAREPDTVAALRTALAAFDNAEAVGAPEQPGIVVTSEYVAGTVSGLGAAEVARRELSLDDLHQILRAQVAERDAEADRYESYGRSDEAAGLRRGSAALARYLPD